MSITVVRTVILYILLIIAMRLMGKRQIGELQPTELVVTLLISNLAAVPMQENGLPLLNGILPIFILVSLELISSILMLKIPALSKLVGGSPITIVRDGKPIRKAMSRLRIGMEDLNEALRQQNVFDLRQVQYAIAETNGHISVYCYSRYQPSEKGDLLPDPPQEDMPVIIISDGTRSDWGMSFCGIDGYWIERTLKKKGCREDQVFLMTATRGGKVHQIILTEETEEKE